MNCVCDCWRRRQTLPQTLPPVAVVSDDRGRGGRRRQTLPQTLSLFLLTVHLVALAAIPLPAADPAPQKPDQKAGEKPSPEVLYPVPDGTPDEIFAFIERIDRQRIVGDRQERLRHAIAVQRARIQAGDKILAQKTDDRTAYDAAEMKLEALSLLASAGLEGALAEALKAAAALKADHRGDIAELAASTWTSLKILSAPEMPADERTALIRSVLDDFQKHGTGSALQTALELGESLEQMTDLKVPADYYEQLSKAVQQVGNPRFEPLISKLAATARRLKLPGNPMRVTGTTVDGQPFDWTKYQNKVVLVDFWATWCGPCRAEIPNVKRLYQRYHAQGFDVVGISADEDLEELKSVIQQEGLPWVNLFEPLKDGQAVPQPTAEHYGISSLPTAILVGRDGKVLSLDARGEELERLLEQQFPKAAQ